MNRKPSIRSTLWKSPWALLLSYEDAERAARHGYLSPKEWEAYRWVWTWAQPRFAGAAGDVQDAFHARFGLAALDRRRRRVCALLCSLTYS